MRIALFATLLVLFAAAASAQCVGSCFGMMGQTPGSGGGGGSACSAGQLDYSDPCNTTQFMVFAR